MAGSNTLPCKLTIWREKGGESCVEAVRNIRGDHWKTEALYMNGTSKNGGGGGGGGDVTI